MVARTLTRNLFEIENARNLMSAELASTFVPTTEFWRLLSPKNHIVLGTRGSGKTALARALSHDVLSLVREDRTLRLVEQRAVIGTFLSARPEWSSLASASSDRAEAADGARRFVWRFNIALAHACASTFLSCLLRYVGDDRARANAELAIAGALGRSWLSPGKKVGTLRQLRLELEELEYEGVVADVRSRIATTGTYWTAGSGLAAEAFMPVRQSMHVARSILHFTEETSWFVILDEAELLTVDQWRIVNTHMRGAPRGMFLKITTMPFFHPTTETTAGVPIVHGNDFEYIWIGRQPKREGPFPTRSPGDRMREDVAALEFANTLFKKRAEQSGTRFKKVTLKSLLGEDSGLLSAGPPDRSRDPRGELRRIAQFASDETIARATRLLNAGAVLDFKNQVWRKMKGAIELREAEAGRRGRNKPPVYYGETVVVRIADNNPRRLIRVFNRLLSAASRRPLRSGVPLTQSLQERELTRLSASEVSWVRSEANVGPELFELVFCVGRFLAHQLHGGPLATDQLGAFRYDLPSDDLKWRAVAKGFGVGIICQNDADPEGLPSPDDAFRLSFVLAPYFRLVPRRGRARSLKMILEWAARNRESINTDINALNKSEVASAYADDQ